MDTGITDMFLAMPPASLANSTLPEATRVHLGPSGTLRVGYDFIVGAPGDPLAPHRITLVGIGSRFTFINTGVRFLQAFDLMYDAQSGVVG